MRSVFVLRTSSVPSPDFPDLCNHFEPMKILKPEAQQNSQAISIFRRLPSDGNSRISLLISCVIRFINHWNRIVIWWRDITPPPPPPRANNHLHGIQIYIYIYRYDGGGDTPIFIYIQYMKHDKDAQDTLLILCYIGEVQLYTNITPIFFLYLNIIS